jgi:pseudouridine-5'-phosphate glycosidase
LDWTLENEEDVARTMIALEELGPEGCGFVVANPLPEEDQLDPVLHDLALQAGLGELKRRDARGKDVTPFLLDRFREETGGESLEVNKQIIRNNARLAARIAVALASLRAEEGVR